MHGIQLNAQIVHFHYSITFPLRFSLHGEEESLAPACGQLEAFLAALPLKVVEGEEVKLTPDPPALESKNAFVVLPYSVYYTGLALPAPYYASPEFPAQVEPLKV